MSVGHVSRLLEEAGIATVMIGAKAWRQRMLALTPPRVVITPHLAGRPVGAPGDIEGQRSVLSAAFSLLEEAAEAGAHVDILTPYTVGRNGNGHV